MYNKSHSRGKDFQLADSVSDIATAIWEKVFPTLEQGTKTTNFLLNIKTFA